MSERADDGRSIARLVNDPSPSCRIHITTGTHIHTTHIHTHAHARTPVLVPRARKTDPCGREYKERLVGVLCFNRLLCLCPIPVSSKHPEFFFCFHGGTRRPIPSHPLSADAGQVVTEIGSPDPLKSRRPGACRASPGAHGSGQLLRCPRRPTKRC